MSRLPMTERARTLHGSGRYAAVLGLVTATFIVAAAAPDGRGSRVVLLALQCATLVVALVASRTVGVLPRVVGVLVATGVSIAELANRSDALTTAVGGLGGLFAILTIVVIARGVVRLGVVNVQTVIGAISVYLLIGILFMSAYGVAAVHGDTPFFSQGTDGTTSIRQYFSFVTLTTVGYGDYTPATGVGRTMANLEALIGQLYLVTVVALLVGRLSHPRGSG
jgi:Ion channel